MFMSSRSRRAFMITALQDAEGWERLAQRAGFVVDQRLEAPLGLDGESAAAEGTVVLVLRQRADPPKGHESVAQPPGPSVLRIARRRR